MNAFQEHALNDAEVCNSCFRRIRVERDVTATTTDEPVSTEKSPYARNKLTTSVEYGPSETSSESIGVFCRCGSESVYDRHWDDGDDRCLAMYRFKELLKRLLFTLEAKGNTLDRKTAAAVAISNYRDTHDVNESMGAGVQAGIHRAAATGRSKTAPLAD